MPSDYSGFWLDLKSSGVDFWSFWCYPRQTLTSGPASSTYFGISVPVSIVKVLLDVNLVDDLSYLIFFNIFFLYSLYYLLSSFLKLWFTMYAIVCFGKFPPPDIWAGPEDISFCCWCLIHHYSSEEFPECFSCLFFLEGSLA